MSRKQWIVAGVVVVAVLVAGVVIFQRRDAPGLPAGTPQDAPVPVLAYCSEEQVKPCVVSFSVDAFDTMLVNILLPDLSFPNFYMKIVHGAGETIYKCQRLGTTLNTAYCVGEKLPPGVTLRLMLFALKDDALLAEGDLPIIGLAFPTVGVAVSTPTGTPAAVETSTATPSEIIVLPTPTGRPSYPNPSYP